jgi:hypothetical protein
MEARVMKTLRMEMTMRRWWLTPAGRRFRV